MSGYIGATVVGLETTAADVTGDITATDDSPELTLKNSTKEDSDGGRESKITFKGEQSGGEETTLAQIESAHDGTSDDEKGDLIFKTNDGNDGAAPTERLRLDSAGDMLLSSPDPSFTITNTTHEDTDGGRESTIVFKGEQSGGELSTLAEIEASHDGTLDDEKGDLIFKTNDGSDGASPTEAMRIDSAQNVGIGTSTPNSKLEVSKTGSSAGDNFEVASITADFGSATTNDSFGGYLSFRHRTGGNILVEPARIGVIGKNNNEGHLVFYGGGGTSSLNAPTEQMRINNGGQVGIGTTSPNQALVVADSSGDTTVAIDNTQSNVGDTSKIDFRHNSITGSQIKSEAIEDFSTSANRTSDLQFHVRNNGTISEGMRIDNDRTISFHGISGRADGSTGHLSISEQNNNRSYVESCSTTTSSTTLVAFRNPNGTVGSITTSGSNTAFNTSSDYRLKENVTNVTDGITRVKQLAPKRFNFIADADTTVDGFLAHEAQTVVPEAVFGTHNEVEVWTDGEELPDGVSVGDNKLDGDGNTIPVYQGIDQSKLVPLLTAALKEAIAKIETLETQNTTQATQIADLITRVEALEGA